MQQDNFLFQLYSSFECPLEINTTSTISPLATSASTSNTTPSYSTSSNSSNPENLVAQYPTQICPATDSSFLPPILSVDTSSNNNNITQPFAMLNTFFSPQISNSMQPFSSLISPTIHQNDSSNTISTSRPLNSLLSNHHWVLPTTDKQKKRMRNTIRKNHELLKMVLFGNHVEQSQITLSTDLHSRLDTNDMENQFNNLPLMRFLNYTTTPEEENNDISVCVKDIRDMKFTLSNTRIFFSEVTNVRLVISYLGGTTNIVNSCISAIFFKSCKITTTTEGINYLYQPTESVKIQGSNLREFVNALCDKFEPLSNLTEKRKTSYLKSIYEKARIQQQFYKNLMLNLRGIHPLDFLTGFPLQKAPKKLFTLLKNSDVPLQIEQALQQRATLIKQQYPQITDDSRNDVKINRIYFHRLAANEYNDSEDENF